ncbi:MAG: hypothetical protein WAN36_14270, partial [Calditrichia bacterium]
MKIIYKQALIIIFATLLLESTIIFFLYRSINAFYEDLNHKLSFLLVEQVNNVINADNLDLSKLSAYNKYPTRRLMSRLSGNNSKILHILLIDTTNHIVLSDDPKVEGQVYTRPEELELLETDKPFVINATWEGQQEILDVIHPLVRDSLVHGYLRAVISVKHLESFYRNRPFIIVIASVLSLFIITLAVFLTSGIYRRNIKNFQIALDHLQESQDNAPLKYGKQDEFSPLFDRLNQLFARTVDLNASFRQSEEKISAMMQVIHE